MLSLKNLIRKIKYNLKFLNKNLDLNLNYTVSSKVRSELNDLMNKYGSDKGGLNNDHNYAYFYDNYFFQKKDNIKNFLEVGLGTNNTNLPSNMGKNGKPLASLRAWREYFKSANIYGADIDKNILCNENRIKTFFVDQRCTETINKMFSEINCNSFDIILEDGLHEFSANINFFETAIKYLKKGGAYIIEDIYYKDKEKFIKYFLKTNYKFSIVDIFHKNNISNNILIIIEK